MTPIRDGGVRREQAIAYLEAHGLPVPGRAGSYSINRGLWGTTWGGGWTHDTWAGPPAELLDAPVGAPSPVEIVLGWDEGLPVSLDGVPLEGPSLVARLGELTDAYGIGRGIHVGETALGIKGRIGFEAGAALVLISAHRELEKLVLTRWQTFWKDQLGRFYGDRRHRGAHHQLAVAGHGGHPRPARARSLPGRGHPQPPLHDGHLHRDLRRGEPALVRRRGPGFRAGLGSAVFARRASRRRRTGHLTGERTWW